MQNWCNLSPRRFLIKIARHLRSRFSKIVTHEDIRWCIKIHQPCKKICIWKTKRFLWGCLLKARKFFPHNISNLAFCQPWCDAFLLKNDPLCIMKTINLFVLPFRIGKRSGNHFFSKIQTRTSNFGFMTSRKSKSSNIPCITQPFTSFRPCLHFYLGKSINNQRLYVFWQYLIELWMYEEAFTLSLTASINAEAVFRVVMLLFFDTYIPNESSWWWVSFNLRLFSIVFTKTDNFQQLLAVNYRNTDQ